MKLFGNLKRAVSAVVVFAAASFSPSAGATLILTIDTYSANVLTVTISGTFSANSIGASAGYLALKNAWSSNTGVHTELFSGNPTIALNTIKIGGTAVAANVANNATWGDAIFFTNPLGSNASILAGTTVSGTLKLTGSHIFNPSTSSTLQLVSGFNRPAGHDDWARLEATAATSTVPEPGTALLFGLGLIGAAIAYRQRARSA